MSSHEDKCMMRVYRNLYYLTYGGMIASIIGLSFWFNIMNKQAPSKPLLGLIAITIGLELLALAKIFEWKYNDRRPPITKKPMKIAPDAMISIVVGFIIMNLMIGGMLTIYIVRKADTLPTLAVILYLAIVIALTIALPIMSRVERRD